MPNWLSKLLGSKESPAPVAPAPPSGAAGEPGYIPLTARPLSDRADSPAMRRPEAPPSRKVVSAPVLVDEEEMSGWSSEIRIKARPDLGMASCVFLVDRPVLQGYSTWIPTATDATESPLAAELFQIPGVESILIHEMTVTVTRHPSVHGPWEPMAKEIGAKIRAHLLSGQPVVSEAFLASIPPEEEIWRRVQQVIDLEVNPGVAAHSGVITLLGVKGNTVTISMGGGCQGCAASTITLKDGIHRAFRSAVPELGAILDDTDHAAGTNPFFKELPEGMRSYA
ncbi:MAG: Fe/S biogenesis protein NfuA [bacterium]|nr:Fe/S biogenesis protein NfuA [bacterium]